MATSAAPSVDVTAAWVANTVQPGQLANWTFKVLGATDELVGVGCVVVTAVVGPAVVVDTEVVDDEVVVAAEVLVTDDVVGTALLLLEDDAALLVGTVVESPLAAALVAGPPRSGTVTMIEAPATGAATAEGEATTGLLLDEVELANVHALKDAASTPPTRTTRAPVLMAVARAR